MNFYLDASAWVKRYITEDGSQWMHGFWQCQPAVASATLGLIEVMATVSRRRPTTMSVEALATFLATVRRDFAGMTAIPLAGPVIRLAEELAERRHLRGADCVHLASALYFREQLGETLTFVASDADLLQAAVGEGFIIADPSTKPPLPTPQTFEPTPNTEAK